MKSYQKKNRRNKKPLATAALLACTAGFAHAQSSVTMYGLADVGLTHINNVAGGSVWKVDSGISTTSRLGFRGAEDLGGGLRAVFGLEAGLNIDTGTGAAAGGLAFNRGSFVGLGSETMGTLTLGRQYDFMYTSLPPDSVPFIQGGLAAGYQGFSSNRPGPPPAVDIHFGGVLYDNSVKWEQRAGPWSGGLMYALGSENSHDSMTSAYFRYSGSALDLGVGWVKDNFTTAVFANEAFAVKGSYRIGSLRLMANYATGKETATPGSKAKIKSMEISANYEITPLASIGVGFGRALATNRVGNDAILTQPFIGGRYRLSRRTELYAMAAFNRSSDPAAVPASVNSPGGATAASSGSSQSAFRFGIVTRF